jgi:hypothetical protein
MNQNPAKKFDWGTTFCWIYAIIGWAVSQPLLRRLVGIASGIGLIWFGVWRFSLDNPNRDAMTASGSSYSTWWLGLIAIACGCGLILLCFALPLHRAPTGKQVREEREKVATS